MCGESKDDQPHVYPPLRAIKLKCLDCCCGSSQEVHLCPVKGCSLWPFRLGKDPGANHGHYPPGNLRRCKRGEPPLQTAYQAICPWILSRKKFQTPLIEG